MRRGDSGKAFTYKLLLDMNLQKEGESLMKKFNRNVNPQSIEAYAKVCQLVSCPGGSCSSGGSSCSSCSCGPEAGILGYGVISSNNARSSHDSPSASHYPSSYVVENN